ncbi:WecB/TagA/CpsF family glycosyltransferase [Solwaraspora sp. WMMD791]|uniref:WecB/TagA/CpsF family glycosyltransferase n=1 Tax=Solwaraspora sp. WMMD791 TaxID=3016086 RepID=UPI00249C4278|nr:WecB/TagA/CpsF family glycosyltransferase [Solwaraspora sp. WMMD791]WFE30202.1 WecB/TagA/CpsF family glycosyltransferase [Solwaraspora sp. WMMD791]
MVDEVVTALDAGRGGQIITPNVDILRRASREPECRKHVESSTLVVADGAPLIWASRLQGDPLPARVPGSDLIWSLSAALGARGRSVYLLGGEPGTAVRAAEVLRAAFPQLVIAGELSPPFGFDTSEEQLAAICAEVTAAAPDLVYVGLGFPKQERLIARLRPLLPGTWFMGCGAAIGFVAGVHRRAPRWMQRTGLEWVHRLLGEPHRLMRRYLLHDVPFALRLLGGSARNRLRPGRPAAEAPTEVSAAPTRRIPAPRGGRRQRRPDTVGTGRRR